MAYITWVCGNCNLPASDTIVNPCCANPVGYVKRAIDGIQPREGIQMKCDPSDVECGKPVVSSCGDCFDEVLVHFEDSHDECWVLSIDEAIELGESLISMAKFLLEYDEPKVRPHCPCNGCTCS